MLKLPFQYFVNFFPRFKIKYPKFSTLNNSLPENEEETNEIPPEDVETNKNDKTKNNQTIEEDFYNYEETEIKIDESDPNNKFLYRTKFGWAKLIASPISEKILKEIKGIHYFNNKISTNYIRKIIKSDKKCLMVFDPETNYKTASNLYKSTTKMLEKIYFGESKRIKNPFVKCKSANEIFNLHRRILIETKNIMNRLIFLVNYDSTVRLKGNVPQTSIIKPFLTKIYPDLNYQKHDFMISFNIYQGMVAVESLEKEGIPIKVLNNKKIYTFYGVWSPTRQDYLELFNTYLEKKKNLIKTMKNAIDLGCGTGILGIILLLKGFGGKVIGIDRNENAVKASNLNSQIMEISDKYRSENIDIIKLNELESLKNDKVLNLPNKYDLIISNPPWITASYLNENHALDNGVYDPKETFLKNIFIFAKKHLSKETTISKKGTLLLIYSDLSFNLGLQQKDRIQQLCQENNLVIIDEISGNYSLDTEKQKIDPLIKFKSDSKIKLYEITRA